MPLTSQAQAGLGVCRANNSSRRAAPSIYHRRGGRARETRAGQPGRQRGGEEEERAPSCPRISRGRGGEGTWDVGWGYPRVRGLEGQGLGESAGGQGGDIFH